MGCLQSKAKAEGGAESTSGLPPAPRGDGSVILSEKATIEERAESLAKRWCACEAMMLQPSMEPERGETEHDLGVGVGDKLESHGGMVHVPRGKHGKAEVVAAVNGGLLTVDEVCERYNLTVEEFAGWQRAIDRSGMPGLRVTRIQHYKSLYERQEKY